LKSARKPTGIKDAEDDRSRTTHIGNQVVLGLAQGQSDESHSGSP